MASTSTNKQPLLIDRPLHVMADLSGKSVGPNVGIDIVGGAEGQLLVDCTKNDGALISDIYTYARTITQTSYDIDPCAFPDEAIEDIYGYIVCLYLCADRTYLNPANAFFIGAMEAGIDEGEFIRFLDAPRLLAPVANLGSVDETEVVATYMQGLFIPKGQCLWAAVQRQYLAPGSGEDKATMAPMIGVQGGYY